MLNQYINSKISPMQFIFLIYGAQVGIGVFHTPRVLAEKASTDGWISIILGWIISTIISILIIQIMKKHPNGTIIDLSTHYFGKWVGKMITILFASYFAIVTVFVLLRSLLYLKVIVFPQLPILYLVILITLPSYLICRTKLQVLSRYAEFVFFFTIWMLLFLLIPLKDAKLIYLLPVLKEGWNPIFSAIQDMSLSFVGFEIAFFAFPYLQKKQDAVKGIVIANTLVMVTYLWITLTLFTFFSPDEITQYHSPVISHLQVISFHFIERIDIIALSLYIFVMSTTWLPYMFLTVDCTSNILRNQNHRYHLMLLLLVICILVIIFQPSLTSISKLQKPFDGISFMFAYIFPVFLWVLLLIIDWVKKGRKK